MATVVEVRMRSILHVIVEGVRRLAGAGALLNAASEVEQAVRSTAEIDAQLGRLADVQRRPAA